LKVPKFISFLLKNSFGTREILLSPEEYENFTYEKNIIFNDGMIHVNNRHHQHIVVYSKNKEEKELRSGCFGVWIRNPSFFIEDRTTNPMKRQNFFIKENYSYAELIMDKRVRNITKHQKDNFPRRIKFLDKNKKVLLELEFNEFGFMVRVIDEFQNTIYEDKEVLEGENFILSKIKE